MTDRNEVRKELTLMLAYINGFDEYEGTFRFWKGFDFATLDELGKEEYIFGNHRNKSMVLSREGTKRAKELLMKYGIK